MSATTIFDNAQHPDFSASGAPIQVGYFRANGTGPGGGGYTLAAGIDNWHITIVGAAPIVVVPVPTLGNLEIALLALAIGLLGLSFARRSR